MRRRQVARRQRAAKAFRQGAQALVAVVALQGREWGVQAARTMLRGQRVGHFQLHFGHEVARLGQHAGTRPIHVARHGAQAAEGPVRGRHVRAHLVLSLIHI